MKRSAYTIIELVIALAITALILTLAVPRYDSYEQELALQNSVQGIATCMQQAYWDVTAASSPVTGTLPISTEQVTLAPSGTSTTCYRTPSDANAKPITPALSSVTETAELCSESVGTSAYDSGAIYSLSVTGRGTVSTYTLGTGNQKTFQYGQAQAIVFTFSTNCNPLTLPTVNITIPATGSPIEVKSQNA